MIFVLDNYDSFTYNLVQYLDGKNTAVDLKQKESSRPLTFSDIRAAEYCHERKKRS